MATIRPFRAIRPLQEYAQRVAALPFDVLDRDQAWELAKDNPYSFLHVDKAEIDLDTSVSPYEKIVYNKALENLNKLISDGILQQDSTAYYYIYRLIKNGRAQTGLVCCASIDDYLNRVIKRHEFTLSEKEQDRTRHVDTLDANTGPIFLACRPNALLTSKMDNWMELREPVYDFTAADGVVHSVWVIDDVSVINSLTQCVQIAESLYIADGHHRTASAAKVGLKHRKEYPNYTGDEEFNYFLSVIFPSDQLEILDYNRVVIDLNGNSTKQFLDKLTNDFVVETYGGQGALRPKERHIFGMYLDNRWYKLTAKPHICNYGDPESGLDVWILQNHLLDPILNIKDPRTDKRIEFIGGEFSLDEMIEMVHSGWKVAFSLCPTSMDDFMAIADAGKVMPPKSTWFEPILLSGFFVHKLS